MRSVEDLQGIFIRELKKQRFRKQPAELYEPFRYILSLGGKRLRPVLLLLAGDLYGSSIRKTMPAAIAIELFHNFTLIHDDIIDKAPLRRGNKTVHEKFNTNIAILSGDSMLIHAYHFLSQCDKVILPHILSVFNKTAIEICEGQQEDMNFELRNDVSIPEYIHMITLKTAVLLGATLKIGGLIGRASVEEAQQLYEFGKNIGIAFQLQDDLLDSFGSDSFGKQIGGDIIQNKKTFLLIKALERSEQKKLKGPGIKYLLRQHKLSDREKISKVIDIYRAFNIEAETEKEIEKYYQKALKHLHKTRLPENKKKILTTFAETLKARKI